MNELKLDAQLREVILNASAPIVIKDLNIPWRCFKEPLSNWLDHFGDDPIKFETAPLAGTRTPQWEKFRQDIRLSGKEFWKLSTETATENKGKLQHHWAALSYRNIDELPKKCREGIDFGYFGFPHIDDECTFWLSSPGTHTPCHYDTYGCNVVVQVFGRKRWLMLPKKSNLTPTRIPYEESSVYCLENFYSPDVQDIDKIQKLQNCYEVILNPGEVLVVPRHWWHYVETIETALSVNAWIPLLLDTESQIDECIVKYIIENVAQNVDILNPNQLTQLSHGEETLQILEYLVQGHESNLETIVASKKYPYQYSGIYDYVNNPNCTTLKIETVSTISQNDLSTMMRNNSRRLINSPEQENSTISGIKSIFINSICRPSIVAQVRNTISNIINETESLKINDLS